LILAHPITRYIVAQILGSFVASIVVYNQWKAIIDLAENATEAAAPGVLQAIFFTPNGPAGAFGNYMLPGQTLPRVFMNEFMNVRLFSSLKL
jgi:glycerol uptake facilitator-like aquaporin